MSDPSSEHREPPGDASPTGTVTLALQDGIGADGGQAPDLDRRTRTGTGGRWMTDSRFWILQLIILALYLARLAATVAFHADQSSLAVQLSTFVIFLIPVTYAALNYGLGGAVLTSGWVALLAVPRFIYYADSHAYAAAWTEVLQVVLLGVLALLIGQRVSADRDARSLVLTAREAHLSAEARYRDLFERNQAPILIVDPEGFVVEANASAQRAFGTTAGTPPSTGSASRAGPPPIRLVDMIGPEAAGHVLTRLISARLGNDGEGDASSASERVEPVAIDVDGDPILYRPSASVLEGPGGEGGMQVVFEDVTAETRRHDQMEAYAARVVLGQEEERRRIAQEIHDGPVQALIHLCRQIDEVDAPSHRPSGDPVAVSDLRATVEDTVAELRSIAKGLRPSILDDLGLVASINQLVTEAGERQRLETSFGVTGTERRLPQTLELALFRIAQEALSNAERHARAQRVAVGMNFDPGGLRLLVKDDGVGFDPSQSRSTDGAHGLGLSGMTERAHLIGGRLVIHSERDNGTTVDVWVPSTDLEPIRHPGH